MPIGRFTAHILASTLPALALLGSSAADAGDAQ